MALGLLLSLELEGLRCDVQLRVFRVPASRCVVLWGLGFWGPGCSAILGSLGGACSRRGLPTFRLRLWALRGAGLENGTRLYRDNSTPKGLKVTKPTTKLEN